MSQPVGLATIYTRFMAPGWASKDSEKRIFLHFPPLPKTIHLRMLESERYPARRNGMPLRTLASVKKKTINNSFFYIRNRIT